jgi:predicted Rossmann fold flavoprotein
VPSLFTFHIDDPRLHGLEGLSVRQAAAGLEGTRLRQAGAVLITHWGLSGPAILRLSAWGARELHARDYRVTLVLNWLEPRTAADAVQEFAALRAAHPRRHVGSAGPFDLPARLWERLVAAAGVAPGATWSGLSNAAARALAAELTAGRFAITGKSMNKEEFVTCGGVRLREVDFRTMESRLCPGLFLAGELLDIDGVTGGFNFQAAWTTGWLAGEAMAVVGRPRRPAD